MVSLNIKNPYRGYRKNLATWCELCDLEPKHPSELDAHHIIPQADFKKRKQKVVNGLNIATLCPSCHRKVTIGEIVIVGRVPTTAGKILEYYLVDNKEIMKYSKKGRV